MKILIFIIVFLSFTSGGEKMKVFNSPGAGKWFPSNEKALNYMLETFFQDVPDSFKSIPALGAIAPHAGYQYSGLGNAYSYACLLNGDIDKVIVLGLSHRSFHSGAVLLDADEYETPLGKVKMDSEMIKTLSEKKEFTISNQSFHEEHSADNQIPFLQYALKKPFQLVVMLIGNINLQSAEKIAHAIKPFLNEKTFVAVSSDFTHYGYQFQYLPFPNDNKVRENIENLDRGAVKEIENLNPSGFADYIKKYQPTICGVNPILVAMNLWDPKDSKGKLIHYYCSGDEDQDYSLSVSYASILFLKK